MSSVIGYVAIYLLIGLLSASIGTRRYPDLVWDTQTRVAIVPLWWLFWMCVISTRADQGIYDGGVRLAAFVDRVILRAAGSEGTRDG